jgi:ABC-type transport system substrate-binding protein
MNVIRKLMIGLGSIVAVALALALASPKTVRAVVSTLVTVSNTSASPAVTEGVPSMATQIIQLVCYAGAQCVQLMPGGALPSTGYTIPAGQNLVITDVQINSPSGGGVDRIGLSPIFSATSGIAVSWDFSYDGTTHEYQLAPGVVWPGGNPIYLYGASGVQVFLRGYLTSQ